MVTFEYMLPQSVLTTLYQKILTWILKRYVFSIHDKDKRDQISWVLIYMIKNRYKLNYPT